MSLRTLLYIKHQRQSYHVKNLKSAAEIMINVQNSKIIRKKFKCTFNISYGICYCSHAQKKNKKTQQTNKTKQCKKEDLKKAKQQQINK